MLQVHFSGIIQINCTYIAPFLESLKQSFCFKYLDQKQRIMLFPVSRILCQVSDKMNFFRRSRVSQISFYF